MDIARVIDTGSKGQKGCQATIPKKTVKLYCIVYMSVLRMCLENLVDLVQVMVPLFILNECSSEAITAKFK